MKRLKHFGALAALCAIASLFAGCSSYKTRDFPAGRTASTYLGAASERGLTISAEALNDPDRAERYLWWDTTRYGFLPVVFRVKNASDETFKIDQASVQFVMGDGTTFPVAKVSSVLNNVRYSPVGVTTFFGYLLGLVPGIASTMHRVQTNSDMTADYEEKHFFINQDAVRVGANDRIDGVVFFAIGQGKARPDLTDSVLEVQVVKERGTGGDVETLVLRPLVEYSGAK
jgi:hypothetical protein